MLFVFPRAELHAMVMRDCPVPVDVAFLDARGRVVAVHEMKTEPPRGAGEDLIRYERRLKLYTSGRPARFAIELEAGTIKRLDLKRGRVLDLDLDRLKELAGPAE